MLVHAGETHPPQSARVLCDIRVSAKCSKSPKREDLCQILCAPTCRRFFVKLWKEMSGILCLSANESGWNDTFVKRNWR